MSLICVLAGGLVQARPACRSARTCVFPDSRADRKSTRAHSRKSSLLMLCPLTVAQPPRGGRPVPAGEASATQDQEGENGHDTKPDVQQQRAPMIAFAGPGGEFVLTAVLERSVMRSGQSLSGAVGAKARAKVPRDKGTTAGNPTVSELFHSDERGGLGFLRHAAGWLRPARAGAAAPVVSRTHPAPRDELTVSTTRSAALDAVPVHDRVRRDHDHHVPTKRAGRSADWLSVGGAGQASAERGHVTGRGRRHRRPPRRPAAT